MPPSQPASLRSPLITFIVFLGSVLTANAADPASVQPYPPNPSYWQYKGGPIILLGGNAWDAPFFLEDPQTFYDELQAVGGNYVRYILKQRVSDGGSLVQLVKIVPFKKLADGAYDLNQWDPEYWERFSTGIRQCEERGIVVQITLWDRFDFYREEWEVSPWNPKNNVNYTGAESGLKTSYPTHPGRDRNPFLKTVPAMENNTVVLPFQERFIAKMMSITLNHGNVLYNMGNEGNLGQRQWDTWWNAFINEKARLQGRTIYTSSMYDKQNWAPVVDAPEAFGYVEGSKVGARWTESGQEQYDIARDLIRQTNAEKRRPINAVKVRTQKIKHHPQERLWRPLMAGFAALSHHRTTADFAAAGGPGSFDDNNTNDYIRGGLGFQETARNNIQAMRTFTDAVPLWETEPHQDLLTQRAPDEAYLRADPGQVYGLYFPDTGSVGLNLDGVIGTLTLRWIDISKGTFLEEEQSLAAGRTVTITTPRPSNGGWAAVVSRALDEPPPNSDR